MHLKRYLINLSRALMGRNPFRAELDAANEKVECAAENVSKLNNLYCLVVDKWNNAEKRIESYQMLIENLRERIDEKDRAMKHQDAEYRSRIAQMKQDYDKRIATYAEEIKRLQSSRKE